MGGSRGCVCVCVYVDMTVKEKKKKTLAVFFVFSYISGSVASKDSCRNL